ncbi:dienelactone hydrolase family protein [Marinicella gelatinilytica]|uniref:dienelactone hydrolase family protein n=1 Tax=Marinicella gelatinilytica TaxID=2996017 RepID=UPI002260BBB1|nr:dienelactone hydrolase family protein [Marinicella gelatinilytica]MCX7544870.1 dienelactone hydrolase family protein [Marinicella gelatinilytica]
MNTRVKTKILNYSSGEVEAHSLLAQPENPDKHAPAILLVPMWKGRVEFIDQKAEEMAGRGMTALAVDLYGKGKIAADNDEAAALMQPLMDDRAELHKRINAGFEALCNCPDVVADKVVAIGYCFGGLVVQDLARINKDVAGIISVHGLFNKPDVSTPEHWQAKVLLLHGVKDPMVSDEDWLQLREELMQADCDWQKHDFGLAYHAFTTPGANDLDFGTVYDADAHRRSEQLITDFIAEIAGRV